MNNGTQVIGPREERALRALLKCESMDVKALGLVIGARNPGQTILQLRRNGFHDIIITRRFKVRDKDGKICLPGEYCIPKKLKPKVEEFLTKRAVMNKLRLFISENKFKKDK